MPKPTPLTLDSPATRGELDPLPLFNQTPPPLVPVRRIGAEYRAELLVHFLALPPDDRYLRFGYQAGDDQIRAYVDSIDFVHDELFGVFDRRLRLIAVAHLAIHRDAAAGGSAEFGVSVLPDGRGRGIGSRLFHRAAVAARNRDIGRLDMQCLTQNEAMLRIARRAGMELHFDGGETEACLTVPRHSLLSQLDAWVENATGQLDFAIKLGLRRPLPA